MVTSPFLVTLAWLFALGACGAATPSARPLRVTDTATTAQLVRLRCAHDGREVVTTWTGSAYAFVPGEAPRRVFGLLGMNVARCLRVNERWHLTSRELMYYLDPASGTVLDRWTNPWTTEVVPVVHVANRLVQNELAGPVPLETIGDTATLAFDIPLFYPNPLAADDELRRYSPAPFYQAAEMFTFVASASALADELRPTVPDLTFSWKRLGPWLPWMNQGERPGYLLYSAHGHKLADHEVLPSVLRDPRLPLYEHAPRCVVAARNETSWTYFGRHGQDYLAGARFPLPAPIDPTECP